MKLGPFGVPEAEGSWKAGAFGVPEYGSSDTGKSEDDEADKKRIADEGRKRDARLKEYEDTRPAPKPAPKPKSAATARKSAPAMDVGGKGKLDRAALSKQASASTAKEAVEAAEKSSGGIDTKGLEKGESPRLASSSPRVTGPAKKRGKLRRAASAVGRGFKRAFGGGRKMQAKSAPSESSGKSDYRKYVA